MANKIVKCGWCKKQAVVNTEQRTRKKGNKTEYFCSEDCIKKWDRQYGSEK